MYEREKSSLRAIRFQFSPDFLSDDPGFQA
jgi:hypothetical protein